MKMARPENSEAEQNEERRRPRWLLPVVALVVVGALVIVLRTLPVRDYLLAVLRWTQELKDQHLLLGIGVVVLTYVVACVFMLPGSVLTLGAGFLFGLVVGTITVSIGSTLGACAAFLVGRTIARGWVERRVSGNPRFAAIDDAVGREGFKIVLLVRLSPIFPFNLQNYGFGLTKVAFWKYALASWIGMIPGTIMYVYFGAGLGSLARAAAGEIERTTAQRVAFWAGLVIAIVVAVFVARIARRALKKAVDEEHAEVIEGEGG
jgi:uncharacterized membrane protein YdjX (TVP38/TMEM64 family)